VDGHGAFERISEAYTVNRLHINQRNLRHKKMVAMWNFGSL